jgi:hypothetical protein
MLFRDIVVPEFKPPSTDTDAKLLQRLKSAHEERYARAKKEQVYARQLYSEILKKHPTANQIHNPISSTASGATNSAHRDKCDLELLRLKAQILHQQILQLQLERTVQVGKQLVELLRAQNVMCYEDDEAIF